MSTWLVSYFEPALGVSSLSAAERRFTVGDATPHALAIRAADELWDALAASPPRESGGKMFGVLVVADAQGRLGYLRGFSGMLDGAWQRSGFVPPLFDAGERDAFWPAGEAELDAMTAELQALQGERGAEAARMSLAALRAQHADELAAQRALHRDRRAERARARARLAGEGGAAGALGRADGVAVAHALDQPGRQGDRDAVAAAAHALDQASRADAAERRRLLAAHAAAIAALAPRVAADDDRIAQLEQRRAERSRALQQRLHDGYRISNARNEHRPLVALFAPAVPPSGAGDCAAPKLLGYAFAHGLTPIALAERWWGPPPASGGRLAGRFYPPCRGKCEPILAHMLDGLRAPPPPRHGAAHIAPELPAVIYEDDWLVVVDKPYDLLSVPGRTPDLLDSVRTRLAARYPNATGPLLAHRLDLHTSGVLVAAKDAETHAAMQQLFASRQVDKQYAAWLTGSVAADQGVIELALRVDLDDRPRQIVDPVHGRAARTEWRVVERRADRTRVVLMPHTGRTHQLRVHAAHPCGLAAPIIGDMLYGDPVASPAARLLLHAEQLRFVHPRTGRDLIIRSPAPF